MRECHAHMLSWLRSFVRVAEDRSLTRAAERLYLTPSALSQHIRNLEAELGVRLFRRERGRSLELEPAGEALVDPAKALLASFDGLRAAMRPFAGATTVRFGVLPGMFQQTLAVVRAFRERHPDMAVALNASSSDSSRAALLDGELDLAILYRHAGRPPLCWEPLGRSPLMLVSPAARSDRSGRKGESRGVPVLDLEELRRLPLPVLTSGHESPGHELFRQAGVPPDSIIHLDSSLHALDIVRAGTGAVIVAAASLPDICRGLNVRPLGPAFPTGEIGLGDKGAPGTEAERLFRAFLRAAWDHDTPV